MSVNQTVVEIVKFTATGLDEITARTKVLRTEAKETNTTFAVTARTLADPAYQRHARLMDTYAKKYETLSLRARNVAAAQRLADGSAVTHLRSVTKLNDAYAQIQRRTELIAKYGERVGGFAAKYGAGLTRAGNVAAVGAGTASAVGLGLARQGFSGTVEQARYDTEMKLLAREFAATMIPVLKLMTKATRYLREQMERLSESGQNAVMGGTLLAGGAASAWAARGVLTGAAARFLGTGGAGAAAGAAAGGIGAAEAAAAGGVAAGATGRMGRVGRYAGRAILPAAAVAALSQTDDYDRARKAGRSKIMSTFIASAAMSSDVVDWAGKGLGLTSGGYTDRQRTKLFGESDRADSPDHRRVALSGGGFEETTGLYDRLQSAIETQDPGKEMRELREALDRNTAAITAASGRPASPPLRERG